MALSTIICTILPFYYGFIPAIAQVSASNHIQRYYLPPPMNFTPMHFECFDEDERPNDEDIENFVWYINKFDFDEADIKTYNEVTFGKKKADLTILFITEDLFVEDGNTIIRCEAKVKPNKSLKGYRIYEVIPGELPKLKLTDVNGVSGSVIDVEENTTGKISCEAEGGVPPISVMQLYLDNSLREETKNSSIISFEVAALHFPDDQNKTLKCKIETVYESKKHMEEKARLNIKAAPRISIQNKPTAEEGKSLSLKVQVLSNPASSVTWWHHPANISGEGKNIESNLPKSQLAQKDGNGVWEITLPEVKKEYFGEHLIIRASNELGENTLSYPILSAASSSGPSLSSVNQIWEGHFLLTGYLLIVAGNHLRFLA